MEREREREKKKEKITVDCCCGCRELASSFFAWPCFQDSSMNRPRTGARKAIFKKNLIFIFISFIFYHVQIMWYVQFRFVCVWLDAHSKQVKKKRHFSLRHVYLVGCEACHDLALTGKSQFPPTEPTSERNSDQKDGWMLLRVLDCSLSLSIWSSFH